MSTRLRTEWGFAPRPHVPPADPARPPSLRRAAVHDNAKRNATTKRNKNKKAGRHNCVNAALSILSMKSRNYSIVCYGDTAQVSTFLSKHKIIKNYAFIKHDKENVEPHIHLLIHASNAIIDEQIKTWIHEETGQNVLAEILIDKKGAYEYLTHDNTDKVLYAKEYIISNDKAYWETDDNKAVEIVNDLLAGCDLYSMMAKYGRDFILNYEKYKNFCDILKISVDKPKNS